MSNPAFAPRPLGVGDLLDESIRLYRRHFLTFFGIGAVAVLPFTLVELLLEPLGASVQSQMAVVGVGILTFVNSVASIVLYQARILATTYAVSEIYLGGVPTIRSALSGGMKRFWGAIGLGILVSLAAGLMAITIVGIPFAVYFGVGWSVAMQALLLEGLGATRAMGRSRELVRGTWWRVLGILIVLGLLQWVIQLVVMIPIGAVFGAILLGGGTISGSWGSQLFSVITSLFSATSQVLVEPIWLCGLVLLYYDLRVRKEGFDLEMQARRLAESAEPDLPPA